MKKILYYVLIISCFAACREQNGQECMMEPIEMQFELMIQKDNPRIKDFTLDSNGKVNPDEVYFYKILDNKQRKLSYDDRVYKYNDSVGLVEFRFNRSTLREDFFTGNLETIYFKTPVRVDTLQIEGRVMPSKGCGEYLIYKHFSVNNKDIGMRPFEIK